MRVSKDEIIKRSLIAFVIWLILTAIIAGMIIHFTGQTASESNQTSKGVLRTLLEFFLGEEDEDLITDWNHYIRKVAHFTLFFAFGFCLTAALQYQRRVPRLPVSLGAGALFAVTDEIRQHFVPGRATQVKDMIIDFCGVLIGALLVTLIAFFVRRHRAKKAKESE